MAQIKMSVQFDKKHRSLELIEQVYLKKIKTERPKYHFFKSSSLSVKKLRFFQIKKKISLLIYELDLLKFLKIHSMISMIHLKQYKENFFDKKFSIIRDSTSIIMKKQSQYVIERIVRAEKKDNKSRYIIKWKNYKNTIWESEVQMQKNIFDMIRRFNKKRQWRWKRMIINDAFLKWDIGLFTCLNKMLIHLFTCIHQHFDIH